MGLAAYTTFDDGPSTTAIVALVVGGVFFALGVIGKFGRLTIPPRGPWPGLSLEPPSPAPESPIRQEAGGRPPPSAPEASAIATPVSEDDETDEGKADASTRSPLSEAVDAYIENDLAGFDSKMREMISAEDDEPMKIGLMAWRLAWLYKAGQAERLKELRELSQQHPESTDPILRMGESFDQLGEHAQSIQTYEDGIANSALPADGQLTLLVALSGTLRKAKRFSEGERKLMEALDGTPSDDARAKLHRALADLYDDWGKRDLKHFHLEKSLEANPSDVGTRFSLAYSYSDSGHRLAAIYHYRIVRTQRGNAWEYNNLGVAMAELDMPITAAKYYRRAIDQHNTLAAANLAGIALASGLADVAEGLVDEAQKQEDVHENVHHVASSLAQSTRREEERLKRIYEGSEIEREMFLRRMQLGSESPKPLTPEEVEGLWDTSVGKMTIVKKDDALEAAFTEAGLWQWQISGTLEGRVYTFKWEHNRTSQNNRGDGYFIFTNEKEFVGIIRHSPTKGEVRSVKGHWEQRLVRQEDIAKRIADLAPLRPPFSEPK